LPDTFPIKNGLKEGDALLPLLLNLALENTIIMVQEIQKGLKFNGAHELAYAGDVNLFGHSLTIVKNI
jgi:hypothetical protein